MSGASDAERAEAERLAALYGLRVGPEALRKTFLYLDLLEKWNRAAGLTGPLSRLQLLNHVFESFWAAGLVPRGASVADVGSGGGLPGLAMALIRPDLRPVLIESNQKKAAFLREACRRLGAEAEVFGGRAEEYPGWNAGTVATMRALKPSARLLEILRRLGARLLILHGEQAPPGLERFERVASAAVPGSLRRRATLLAPAVE